MGCIIATNLASRYKQVEKLVLISPAFIFGNFEQNKEDLKAKAKEYVKTEQGKEVRRKCNRNYFSKDINRFKHNARKKVLRALQKGTLIKPSECEVCGLELPLQAHHHDYSKPLDVQWVCIQCHENIHHLNEGNTSLE